MMSNQINLKPCPFCGSSVKLEQSKNNKLVWIVCSDTNCVGSGLVMAIDNRSQKSFDRGLSQWNNRISSDQTNQLK